MDFNNLKKHIPFEVLHIGFSNKAGFKFLDIELPDKDLDTIQKKTLVISKILDEIDSDIENYYLNVYSSGTEKNIKINDIDKYLNCYIMINLHKHQLNKNCWEGMLININDESITIQINNKGRFQKLIILKSNIKDIKITAKL